MLSLLALVLLFQQFATDPARDIVQGDDAAYALMPPELVCAPDVADATWSSDGRYLLVSAAESRTAQAQLEAAIEKKTLPFAYAEDHSQLVVYSLQDRTAQPLWQVAGFFQTASWIGTSHQVAAVVTSVWGSPDSPVFSTSLIRSDAETGATVELASWGKSQFNDLYMLWSSPSLPIAVLDHRPSDGSATRLALLSGNPASVHPLELPKQGTYRTTRFAQDGTPRFIFVRRGDNDNEPNDVDAYQLGEGGALEHSPKDWPRRMEPAPKYSLIVENGGGSATFSGSSSKIRSLWIHSNTVDSSAALVSADGNSGQLSPEGDAVFYKASGAGFIRRLVRIPLDLYSVAMKDVAKKRAMNAAKSVALAVLIYSADNHDKLPGRNEFFDAVRPYMRDASDLQGFVYLLNGGFTSDIKNPAATVLGYSAGPDGFAVSFADGHVEWRLQPPG